MELVYQVGECVVCYLLKEEHRTPDNHSTFFLCLCCIDTFGFTNRSQEFNKVVCKSVMRITKCDFCKVFGTSHLVSVCESCIHNREFTHCRFCFKSLGRNRVCCYKCKRIKCPECFSAFGCVVYPMGSEETLHDCGCDCPSPE